MIVPMKKITLLCLEEDQDATLKKLRDLGALHLLPMGSLDGRRVDSIKAEIARTHAALTVLRPLAGRSYPSAPVTETDPVARILDIQAKKKLAIEQLDALRSQQQIQLPLGDFEPALVSKLAAGGIKVRLFRGDPREMPRLPDTVRMFTIKETAKLRYFAVIGEGTLDPSAEEIPIPDQSLTTIDEAIRGFQNQIAGLDTELTGLAASVTSIQARLDERVEELRFAEAAAGAHRAGRIACLQGFCPVPSVQDLRDSASTHGWGLRIDDPSPDDVVPTLIKTPAWVKPIKSLFGLLEVLPGYTELDVSVPFFIFFTIFFGILVGDAGYGATFLILTVLCRFLFRKAPAPLFWLLGILSTSTIIWGVITGNYFGFTNVESANQLFRIPWLMNEQNLFTFCFMMGAIHLTVGHSMRALHSFKGTHPLSQAGWILMTWGMYFLARLLIIGTEEPTWLIGTLIGSGAALVVLHILINFKSEWMSLTTFFFDVIGDFSDVVSYIRLFAVGAAGLAVAQAFNDLAIADGVSSIMAGIGAAIILFIGHALNMVLCIMSVLVHGVRLNALEFSGHAGLAWTGYRYDPFRRRAKQIES